MGIKQKVIVTVVLLVIVFAIFFLVQWIFFNDGKLHVVFCDVGQGDGIYIRTPQGSDIVIDGGPDSSMLSCLSSHMPFWDHTIELAALTHPHADHMVGFIDILQRYKVNIMLNSGASIETDGYKEFKKRILHAQIREKTLYSGERFSIDSVQFETLWPTQVFMQNFTQSSDLNQASLVFLLSYKDFDALLTGDAESVSLSQIPNLSDVEVLKVPHHGSKVGLTRAILQRISPEVVVISVGIKNKYGHPSQESLMLLDSLGTAIFRTDKYGTTEIVSNGKSFSVKH